MKCPECQAKGEGSCVYRRGGMVYPIGSHSFWDEDGREHIHDSSTHVSTYACSNGHVWEKRQGGGCWCGWESEPYDPQRRVAP